MATAESLQRSMMEAERNRVTARQIELADEANYHRVKDEQMARMTAFNGQMLQQMANRPQTLPAAVAPQMISNVTNIQNITPTSYFENIQNIYQTTNNLHQNSLNFIANTAVKMVNLFGPQTTGPGERGEGIPFAEYCQWWAATTTTECRGVSHRSAGWTLHTGGSGRVHGR